MQFKRHPSFFYTTLKINPKILFILLKRVFLRKHLSAGATFRSIAPSMYQSMELAKHQMDEQELIAGCKAGKTWAQKAVYEQHASIMMGVCLRYVNDRETARDLLQDGFIKVFTRIETYTGAGAFGGWIRRIFVTTALEYLRQKDALRESDSLDLLAYSIENDNENIVDKLSAKELMQCIARLPDGYRTVFNLYAIEGYSHAEIAGMMGINEATSRSQFMRARKMLQKIIEPSFQPR